jgi:hypothetical protein
VQDQWEAVFRGLVEVNDVDGSGFAKSGVAAEIWLVMAEMASFGDWGG